MERNSTGLTACDLVGSGESHCTLGSTPWPFEGTSSRNVLNEPVNGTPVRPASIQLGAGVRFFCSCPRMPSFASLEMYTGGLEAQTICFLSDRPKL
jgi:hypothetical protein